MAAAPIIVLCEVGEAGLVVGTVLPMNDERRASFGSEHFGSYFWALATIPTRHFFRLTGILITFMAAGIAAQSVAFLVQAEIATALDVTLWNTTSVLSDNGVPGHFFHALFGYISKSTELQMLVYLTTLVTIFSLMKLVTATAMQWG